MLFHPFKLTTSYAPVQAPIPMTKRVTSCCGKKPNLTSTKLTKTQAGFNAKPKGPLIPRTLLATAILYVQRILEGTREVAYDSC